MTIPGVDVITASTLRAVIGDVHRFPTARHLVGYLGLHPKIRQSGPGPARHRTSKEGSAAARHVLVEAAWAAARTTGPLRVFAERISTRRGCQIATVAVARKLAVLAWHLLTRGEDYAFARPGIVARKRRRLELAAGAPRRKSGPNANPVWASTAQQHAERRIAEQAVEWTPFRGHLNACGAWPRKDDVRRAQDPPRVPAGVPPRSGRAASRRAHAARAV